MQITQSIRRSIAAVILTAGLAYPACAAVCPKGIGGCTSPGRCFLFVDADGNSLCDYTGRTGSQASAGSIPAPSGAPSQATAVPTPDTTATQSLTARSSSSSVASVTPGNTGTALQDSSTGSLLNSIHLSVPLVEVLLFLAFTALIFALIREGIAGIRIRGTFPALALSALFGLPLSLVTTSVLAGSAVAGTVFALVYMAIAPVLVAYLWYAGAMSRKIVLLTSAISAVAGFVFVAPVMPTELGGIVTAATGTSALTVGIIIICAVIVLAVITGRTFCSSICPVGSLQELAYAVPFRKIVIGRTRLAELIRLVLFAATAIAAVYLVDLMAFTGFYDLFSLTLTAGFAVAAGLLLVSIVVYRPVCRILCPFGVLFSLFSEFSWFRLRRTPACIGCRRCERACPARVAGDSDPKRECYLCGRCTEACPEKTALAYRH
nr:4Fe-4S binding protein [uncultured Methanoregula sp.]